MADRLSIFRVGITLRARSVIKLKPLPWATVHALLRAAYGAGLKVQEQVIPDGLMPDAPERCRFLLDRGASYRVGYTLLAFDAPEAARITATLLHGLGRLGKTRPKRPVAFGGNFDVVEARDVVGDRAIDSDFQLEPIAVEELARQTQRAQSHRLLTLNFLTPYRAARPSFACTPGHQHIDGGYFDAAQFLRRLQRRLEELGLLEIPVGDPQKAARLADNRLIWFDLPYGPGDRAKTLGGTAGRVTIECHDLAAARQLVLGQYVRVGNNTSFGLGAYRIEELGHDRHVCPRSNSLLELAMSGPCITTQTDDLPAGELQVASRHVLAGSYTPAAPIRIETSKPDGGTRLLAIPRACDRALQRRVLISLAPAMDQLFEESSFAYRKGLGRHSAAHRIRHAISDGYTFALHADFERFFDSVDHRLLRDRLEATLGDDEMTEILMRWVISASPVPGRGLPTGAPISPMLANLFLNEFDEEISRRGGMLVRYADDFLIFYRDRETAEHAMLETEMAARHLALSLNESKTHELDPRQPFEFLGFQFHHNGRWTHRRKSGIRLSSDLGWQMIEPSAGQGQDFPDLLPGETGDGDDETTSWVIFGPSARQVRLEDKQLICMYEGEVSSRPVTIDHVRELIVLGHAIIQPAALHSLMAQGTRLVIADDGARHVATISPEVELLDADLVSDQVARASDPVWRLAIARRLISAKVWNHACLTRSLVKQGRDRIIADALFNLVATCEHATSLEQLRGYEGVAAAHWFSLLGRLFPEWCRFQRRVAPDGEDPGNIMLNLAHTAMHRQVALALRGAGLVPSIGILHEPRAGHATLASDLQEPFRHLMDRAVLRVARDLRPTDFKADPHGPYTMKIQPAALRKLLEAIHLAFAARCSAGPSIVSRSYIGWFHSTARSLRAHLLERSKVFEIFRHDVGVTSEAAP